MLKHRTRAIVLGLAIFAGLLIAKIIGNKPITIETLIGPLVGALVAGLVVYFLGGSLLKNKKG